MPPRRHVQGFDDAPIDDEFLDEPPSLIGDVEGLEATSSPHGVRVCLLCGQMPPRGGDCSHDEVARIDRPSEALLAAARRLQAAAQVKRQQERTLRQLATREAASGGEIVRAQPPSVVAQPAPPLPVHASSESGPSPAAGPDERGPGDAPPSLVPARRSKRKLADPSQVAFSFAEAETEPAPGVAPLEPPVAPSPEPAAPGGEAPEPRARRRKPQG